MSIGEVLRANRKRFGLRQADVAESLGVARNTYSRWELGKYPPPLRMVRKLSVIYDVGLEELIGREA